MNCKRRRRQRRLRLASTHSRPCNTRPPRVCLLVCVSETKFVNEQVKMLEKIRFARLANALQWECVQNSVAKHCEVLQNFAKKF